ncbi:MAG: DUF4055 domain-containing protein [Pseudomonadales bacterium]|nr:DUF4055 domain-containing protein [Pseudomonadales bacterium]
MPVTTTHPEYDAHYAMWEQTRDCCTPGAVKSKKTKYLPATMNAKPGKVGSEENTRYESYLARATFVGITGRTLNGLIGAVFRKPATVELPAQIEYLIDDADGKGNTLEQVAKSMISNQQSLGRHGLLCDSPAGVPGMSQEEATREGIRPKICEYKAESIINWKEQGGKLILVVLKESRERSEDKYDHDCESVYRVLEIEEGRYVQRLFDEHGEQIGEDIIPSKAGGAPWEEIPFVFPGALNNDPCVDPPPLYDMSELNLGHYRNSADFEKNLFIHSGGTLFVSSKLSADEWKTMNPNGITVGADAGHFLGDAGSATLLQLEPAQATDEAMKRKEEQMIAIGAKLIDKGAINETAEAARINATSETSVLDTIVGNGEDAIVRCLQWCAEFQGADPESIKYELNKEFFDRSVDPQTIMAGIQLYDRGIIAKPDMVSAARRAKLVDSDRTDEEIEDDIDTNGPTLSGFESVSN